jgi:hypothetical protein
LEAVGIEQPAGEVDSHDRAVRRGALPRQTDSGERCTVRAAGQQADIGRRVVWGQFGVRRRHDFRFRPDIELQRCPFGADGETDRLMFTCCPSAAQAQYELTQGLAHFPR